MGLSESTFLSPIGITVDQDDIISRFGVPDLTRPALASFFDQSAIDEDRTIIIITHNCIELWSHVSGDRIIKQPFEKIYSSCYKKRSALGSIIAVAFADCVRLLSTDLQTVKRSFDLTENQSVLAIPASGKMVELKPMSTETSNKNVTVSCVSVPLENIIVIGNDNGDATVYFLTTGSVLVTVTINDTISQRYFYCILYFLNKRHCLFSLMNVYFRVNFGKHYIV